MKKLIILFFPILLASCFGPSDDEVQKAKNELLNPTPTEQTTDMTVKIGEEKTIYPEEKSYTKVTHLTSETFIEIQPISNIEKITDELDLKGIVNNLDIDKIVVSFKNSTSKFPTDEYNLKAYKKGSKEFLYRAHKKYQVLDYGLNTYTIDGYVGEHLVSKIEVEVFLAAPSKVPSDSRNETAPIPSSFTGDILEVLPTDETTYGTPNVDSEAGVFTYSQIPDFQAVKNDEMGKITCDNFAEYLKENYTWYYWNTCRPISDENNFTVNVLTLSGDQYKYERHYVIAKYGIYGKLLLESGTGIMQDELQAKNDELKTKTFVGVENADKLLKDILK